MKIYNNKLARYLMSKCPLFIIASVTPFVLVTTYAATNAQLPKYINPISMLTGSLEVETELAISSRFSIGPLFTNKDFDFAGEEFNVFGYGIRAEWYFTGKSTSGAFLSPFAKVWSFDPLSDQVDQTPADLLKFDSTTYGALLGYNWMARSFRIHTGIGWAISNYDRSSREYNLSKNTTSLVDQSPTTPTGKFLIDLSIGWSF